MASKKDDLRSEYPEEIWEDATRGKYATKYKPMFKKKHLDWGLLILSPEHDVGKVRWTTKTLAAYHRKVPCVCAVPKNAHAQDCEDIKSLCTLVKGKDTITSLINAGIKKCDGDWIIIVFEGNYLKQRIDLIYSQFIQDDSDVLFPIMNRISDFPEASMSGLCINKAHFKKVGNMSEEDNLQYSKLVWMAKAVEKGSKFKAILGPKLL